LKTYDFIIIGAGSGGAALAGRLSENGNYSVLLLEAGKAETILSDVPALAQDLQNTDIDWAYRLEPSDDSCLGMTDKKCAYPRGKVIGGCSVMNYMIYTRGHKLDWDRTAQAGNLGW
jgi:choline dehydrogenase-like flavoprotein